MELEIWSDIVCPWCYIGKRRIEAALVQFDRRDEVRVRYRSFELAPDREPNVDQGLSEMLAAKYGVSLDQARAMNDRVTAVAAGDGLEYHLERARPGNTFDAHRVTHLAAAAGIQEQVLERLYSGYFSEGAAIGDHEVLVGLATDAGLDADEVRETLASDRFADDVRADELLARRIGITGVPFFVVDRRFGVSGAQGADVLLGVLEHAVSDSVGSERPRLASLHAVGTGRQRLAATGAGSPRVTTMPAAARRCSGNRLAASAVKPGPTRLPSSSMKEAYRALLAAAYAYASAIPTGRSSGFWPIIWSGDMPVARISSRLRTVRRVP